MRKIKPPTPSFACGSHEGTRIRFNERYVVLEPHHAGNIFHSRSQRLLFAEIENRSPDEEADRQDRQEKIHGDNQCQYLSHNRTFNERLVAGQGRDVGYGGAGDLAQCFPCQERLV
jgi:hypothetical protein